MYVKLRKIRLSKNMTLKELSQMSHISVNALSLIETNAADPRLSTICKITNALGTAICQIVDCE